MRIPDRIAAAAERRISAASDGIQNTLEQVRRGCPLNAETDLDRKLRRIEAVVGVDSATAAAIAENRDPASLGLAGEQQSRAEALQGKTVDYLRVAWLDAGRLASNAVARVASRRGDAIGTGFLISDRLLITNNHVMPTREAAQGMMVEFRYEIPLGQRTPSPARFALDPGAFFETDDRDDLDYTVIALGAPITAGASLAEFGKLPLSASAAKHSVGEPANVIQHPDGDYKQIVIRENRIVFRGDTVLHYLADTEPGASGSPVFNDQWQVVALHHWGSPHREISVNGTPLQREVNEGIRVSAIVRELEQRASGMNANQRALLRDALTAGPVIDLTPRGGTPPVSSGPQSVVLAPSDSRSAATSAIEAAGFPASRIDPNYRNRRGYNPRFLRGFSVPLPQLNRDQQAAAARVSGVGNTGNPFELKYEHFSVVLNARRRMPFFSACNIDGASRFRIDRDTLQVISGPEATEAWKVDPRAPAEAQLDDPFYQRLRDAFRFGDPRRDFFARGHMTRREDPNWGTAAAAVRANLDTFHHPNACPQINKAFNASQKVWQGIENFILDSTDAADVRTTVITGPVFADDDPPFADEESGESVLIPRRFWKVVAWVEEGEPKAFALLADQSEAMDKLMSGREAREAIFTLPAKLRVFRSTVAEIARLTELDFGDLANHDVNAGESLAVREVASGEALLPGGSAGGFGTFDSIGDFLEQWESRRRADEIDSEPGDEGAEKKKKRPRPGTPKRPQARQRSVVELEAEVARVFADDLSGSKHQQFSIRLSRSIAVDARVRDDVKRTLDSNAEVRVAIRFGDSRGIADRVPGIRTGVALHVKGEWIPASEAFVVAGERMAVLHFTHDPLGFVCTPVECFS